jgi:hypothetical protein
MKYPFLLVLIVLALIIIPASARIEVTGGNIDVAQTIRPGYPNTFSYTCDPDEKISIIEYDLAINTVANFTLTYGTGATVEGWMIYRPAGIAGQSYSEVSIGGNKYSETFIDAQVAGYSLTRHIQFVSYARNTTGDTIVTGFAVYAQGYGVFSDEIAFYPVSDLTRNMIYGMSITATQGTGITVVTNKAERLADFVDKTVSQSSTDVIAKKASDFLAFLASVGGIIYTILYWLKFIFIDNIAITFTFLLLGTLAYYMNTSPDIFVFFKRLFGTEKMIIEFLINIFDRAWRWITRT